MDAITFESYLIYFFPAVALILVPNRWIWFGATMLMIVYLYRGLLWSISNPQIMFLVALVAFPAILLKVGGIILRNREKVTAGRILPLFGLAGPVICVFFSHELETFLETVIK